MSLRGTDDELQLDVSDDGGGFDPSHEDDVDLGLVSMEERLNVVNGTPAIEST